MLYPHAVEFCFNGGAPPSCSPLYSYWQRKEALLCGEVIHEEVQALISLLSGSYQHPYPLPVMRDAFDGLFPDDGTPLIRALNALDDGRKGRVILYFYWLQFMRHFLFAYLDGSGFLCEQVLMARISTHFNGGVGSSLLSERQNVMDRLQEIDDRLTDLRTMKK